MKWRDVVSKPKPITRTHSDAVPEALRDRLPPPPPAYNPIRSFIRDEQPQTPLPGPAMQNPATFEAAQDLALSILDRLDAIDETRIEAVADARRGLLTREVEATILAQIISGAYEWVACASVGISPQRLAAWVKRGERGEEPFVSFARRLRQARAMARARVETLIASTRPELWLQRGPGKDRGPDEPGWSESGGTKRVEHTGRNGGPILVGNVDGRIDMRRLSSADLGELDRLTAKMLGEGEPAHESETTDDDEGIDP